jgi:hypothetical protein
MDRQERFCAFKSKKHNPYKEHSEFFKKEKIPQSLEALRDSFGGRYRT